jgi:hypothetical protein
VVRANRVENYDGCRNPGDYFITSPNSHENNCRRLSFLCPCGCGQLCGIRINDVGDMQNFCWAWNKVENKVTVTPSINISNGHWHGYLTDGVFNECGS